MTFRVVKSGVAFLLFLNFCMYLIVAALSGWAVNFALDHDYDSPRTGTGIVVGFSPTYFPMGNEATGYMLVFALVASVVGAASCFVGLNHLRVWNAQSLASTASSAVTAWVLTVLAMGMACKENRIGTNNRKLRVLEVCLVLVAITQLIYLLFIHAGYFGGRYLTYQDNYVERTTAQPQKGTSSTSASV